MSIIVYVVSGTLKRHVPSMWTGGSLRPGGRLYLIDGIVSPISPALLVIHTPAIAEPEASPLEVAMLLSSAAGARQPALLAFLRGVGFV